MSNRQADPEESFYRQKKGESISKPDSQPTNDYKTTIEHKQLFSKFEDPCAQAREDSMKCLDRNAYDRSACSEYFAAFRDCKKIWMNKRRDDRLAGRI